MIIFLHGIDGYRLKQARDDLIARYRAKHPSGLNISMIYGADRGAIDSLEHALKSLSFFKEVRLVVFNNILDADHAAVLGLLERYHKPDDKECVILATHSDPKPVKANALFSHLINPTHLVRHFELLEGAKLAAWLKREAVARGTPFTAGGLSRFLTLAGTEGWNMINNLDKLANFCVASTRPNGGPSLITATAVEELVRTDVEPNIFEFIDALGRREAEKAYALLYQELARGRDPYYILSMIAYQFRNMLVVKDSLARTTDRAVVAKKTGLHPFVIRKMQSSVSVFSLDELKTTYGRLLELELTTKNGTADLQDQLFAMALQS
ncbi:MAG: DNA polymerase III subunit delta [Candidatus Yanofskybacteria bacterium RIFCSPHIGHO2_02_FULL_50_12]|uniref:DNA-directed DNA polymerase n=1 Tax=Candidatus Yanofskybacteria bacterium RIFCSPHIGHO2_02_FULL_50_12 TaxID=1802685 RepID=A0A1F8FWG9_9BACT|nr:MAG: DNA polymerase III subunit delta [Candidatus Yanofskybacteria bacterium RIFCSPHIGHO2_02_FULL_50_12]